MRTRSSTVSIAFWLLSLGVLLSANPAWAAPKKKKQAAASAEPAAPAPAAPTKEKNVDDLMSESATRKTTSSAAASDSEKPAEPAEEVGEPDAWERPPVEEEKPKVEEAPKVVESYGDGRRIEIALAPVFGFKTGEADWASLDPYGFGAALRGGYTLDSHIYIGAGFVYYLGNSKDDAYIQRGGSSTGPISISQNYMLAYAEGGYDFWFGNLIFRPSMWLGLGMAVVDPHPQTNALMTVYDFMFAPGLGLFYTMDGWFLGGDVRYTIVTGDGAAGLNLFANVGLRF